MTTNNNLGFEPGNWKFKTLTGVAMLAALFLWALSHSGCKSCNKPSPAPLPDKVDVINDSYKPKADSLEKVVKHLSDSISLLKKQVSKVSEDRKALRQQLVKAGEQLADAIEKGDTVDLINALQDQVVAYEDYILQSDKEIKLQGKIIERQDSLINASFAETELQKSKFKTLADEYRKLDAQYALQQNKLARTEKKLRRAKWVNSVAVPATVVGATSVIAPAYTLPAVGVGVALHFILKPKKK